mgnify:CR=1
MQAVANVYTCRLIIDITEPTTGFNELHYLRKASTLIEIHYCHLHSAGILLFE